MNELNVTPFGSRWTNRKRKNSGPAHIANFPDLDTLYTVNKILILINVFMWSRINKKFRIYGLSFVLKIDFFVQQ